MSGRPPQKKAGDPRPRRSSARAGFRTPGVLVLRHGLSEWNAEQRWQGWADIDLAPEGVAQAASAAAELATWPRSLPVEMVASDLVRAQQTARPIARALAAGPFRIDDGFRERGVGEWSGRTTEEIEQLWPGMLTRWRDGHLSQLPGGEDETEFRERITAALRRACNQAVTNAAAVVVVSHGGVIRTLERLHHVEPRPVGNLGGRWFFLVGGEVRGGSRVDLRGRGPDIRGTAL
jgi:glucosyl-3-phosphoglycerate phosphatase